jgi:hypothetical protein
LEAILAATLHAWRTTPFVWGKADCLISTGDYAGVLTGTDPAAPWRGTYATEAEAMAILGREGGPAAVLGRALLGAGLEAVAEPMRGDCVSVGLNGHEVGGICLGDRVGLRLAGRGLFEVHLRLVKVCGAWRA